MPKAHNNKWNVYHGSCLDILPKLGKYDFIFADPPFGIGQEYQGFVDVIPHGEHFKFTANWICECITSLNPYGILCLHGCDAMAELYLRVMHQYADQLKRVAWLNWWYDFGQCNYNNWIDSRCHCLVYSEGNYVWNPQDVLIPSARATKYNDKRIHETKRGGKRLPGTTWGIPADGIAWGRVQGNNRERRPSHPNQLPIQYMARLIKAYTNTDSKLLDPFGGSGSTICTAKALGRSCDTIDISLANCESIKDRLTKEARFTSERVVCNDC